MDGTRELRKFPKGERCNDCGARRWYLENGLRFCSNGHQVEGFVQYDAGEEEEAGKLGDTARRDKEIKEKELRHLTGQAGRNLYLECLQLILRNQLLWLVNEKGHREELETVVRDLWDLRTRGSSTLATEENDADAALEMFSSQPGTPAEPEVIDKSKSRGQSWDPARGSHWPMPRMIDTLVLCYLGCLLLRIPTRVGDFCQWANSGHMPYKRAYYDLAQEMQDRLPSAYTRALKLPLRTSVKAYSLHAAILDMALSYQLNYELLFPAVTDISVIIQYCRQLCLPVEVAAVTKKIIEAMQMSSLLPTHKSRVYILDHPEILLLAALVVATKLCCPFTGHPRLQMYKDTRPDLIFNWNSWKQKMENFTDLSQSLADEPDFEKVKVDQVTTMTAKELDAYFAYITSFIDKKNENSITAFFPSENAPALEPPQPEITEDQVDERLRNTLADAITLRKDQSNDTDDESGLFGADKYEAYQTTGDLSPQAKDFYKAAGNAAGLSLDETVRAVYMLEQRILVWQRGDKLATEEMPERMDVEKETQDL